MSRRKSERLVNLLILLLSAQRFVSRDQIRHTIEGYAGLGDAAFERMFERDKEDLRSLGAPIITGSNDPDSDEVVGYRIRRGDFELPPVAFTPEERAVLGVAAQAWQDSVAARHTADALETLRAAGADPDPARLQTLVARLPAEPGFDAVWEALHQRRAVSFGYRGQTRTVHPWRLQQRGGRWYLTGHDVDRDAPRHFKLARFETPPEAVGPEGAYPPPTPEQLAALTEVGEAPTTVTVALRQQRGADLRRRGRAVAVDSAPNGFDAVEVEEEFLERLVGEVAALGADAVVLAPESVRELVVGRLRAAVERRP